MLNTNDVAGCRVMISAGASGIGRAMADGFIEAGALVHICDISDVAIADAAHSLPLGSVFKADVSEPDQVDAWFRHATDAMGGLDVLINNAGMPARPPLSLM